MSDANSALCASLTHKENRWNLCRSQLAKKGENSMNFEDGTGDNQSLSLKEPSLGDVLLAAY